MIQSGDLNSITNELRMIRMLLAMNVVATSQVAATAVLADSDTLEDQLAELEHAQEGGVTEGPNAQHISEAIEQRRKAIELTDIQLSNLERIHEVAEAAIDINAEPERLAEALNIMEQAGEAENDNGAS